MSIIRKVAAALGVVILATVSLSLLAATVPATFGWQPRVVISGSMEPAISPGDVVLVKAAQPHEVRPGLVILADVHGRPGSTYLHRVVGVEAGKVLTRGDANRSNDHPALQPRDIRGRAGMIVPLIGWPMLWIQERSLPMLFAAAATGVVLVAALIAVRPLWRKPVTRGARRRRRRLAQQVTSFVPSLPTPARSRDAYGRVSPEAPTVP